MGAAGHFRPPVCDLSAPTTTASTPGQGCASPQPALRARFGQPRPALAGGAAAVAQRKRTPPSEAAGSKKKKPPQGGGCGLRRRKRWNTRVYDIFRFRI